MEKITWKLQKPDGIGILHDSRADAKVLKKAVNLLIDKINELIEENTVLKGQIADLQNKVEIILPTVS